MQPKTQEVDALLRTRYGGAVNIRGIRYQMLYSVLRAFGLYAEGDGPLEIRLEGIEDIDLLGLRLGDEYVQVKSSQAPWNWSKLKEPIQRFLEVHRAEPRCRFVLAVDFPLRKDIARLAQIGSLSRKERRRVGIKFRKLCLQAGAPTHEADALASRLEIVSVPETQIRSRLRLAVARDFGLGSEAVDTYISVLVDRFLDWAKDRRTLTRSDLETVRGEVGQALARETQFQAYGRGLIGRISWEPDANVTDFFEGKATRPGHIAAGADVRRPTWLERIDNAVLSSKICIIRSSSGQGKSTLMYRYAYERWPHNDAFALRVAQDPEHVELVCNYLRFRAKLGLPTVLLVDDAGWRTRLWPLVAQECAALGIRVLVSVRHEDWHRFARESLTTWEVLEPILDLDEAGQIFQAFQSQGKIHASVDSPEWAYERIGEPHLLMEYVYLLTHGQMLEERLRDQVRQFSEQGEDPAKIEIVRRVALADTLGAPMLIEDLLQSVELTDDAQQVLGSLDGEYVDLGNRVITGLHWVRSDHLARILHEGYPNPANTALAVLEAIAPESVTACVANAMCIKGLDVTAFTDGLIEKAKNASLDTILAFVEGIFEAGERHFFLANRGLFDEAYELIGPAGVFLLSSEFLPIVKVDSLARFSEILDDHKGDNFRKLLEIASRAKRTARGLDLCGDFLCQVTPLIAAEALQAHLGHTGDLLDWCFLCEVSLPIWATVVDDLLASAGVFDLSLDVFCSFAQGLYRYDQPSYMGWFSQNRSDILGYLKLYADCFELEVSDEQLHIEFFPEPETEAGGHEQAMSRLRQLRRAIPFCGRYQSKGTWLLPFGLRPSCDETKKDIPKEYLPFASDIEKNVVWKSVVETTYLPDSYYRFEEAWYRARRDGLALVRGFSQGLRRTLVGRRFDFGRVFEGGELPLRLDESLQKLPDPPYQTPEDIKQSLKAPKEWAQSLRNSLSQIAQYNREPSDDRTGRLAVYNFLEAIKVLPAVHGAFAQLFQIAPDYFKASELKDAEIITYRLLADLLDAWIIDPPTVRQRDILRYIRTKRERNRHEMLRRLRGALVPVERIGITVIVPSDAHVDHPLRYIPLAFSVDNPCNPERELGAVIEALVEVKDLADFFCLVPIHRDARFIEGGYQLSSRQVAELMSGRLERWETLVPHELPEGVLAGLPALPFRPSPRLELQSNVLALLGQMQVLVEQKVKAEALGTSTNRFELQLYERYNALIRQVEINLGLAASAVLESLTVGFGELEGEPAYGQLAGFLESLARTGQRGSIEALLLSPDFDVETLVAALENIQQEG